MFLGFLLTAFLFSSSHTGSKLILRAMNDGDSWSGVTGSKRFMISSKFLQNILGNAEACIKLYANKCVLTHDRASERHGSIPGMTSQLLCIAVLKEFLRCKAVCEVISRIGPWLSIAQSWVKWFLVLLNLTAH